MSLEEKLKTIPNSSGVYQYFDQEGKLLYVGKAKNLKNRVKSYFKFVPFTAPSKNLSSRISKMISETKDIKYILVKNEQDALVLEDSLIKQLKPKYNILLRDDKTYPYIGINLSDEYPRFEIIRKIENHKGIKYFGPFTSSSKNIIDSLYLLFNLVQKKNCLNSKRACLFHQMKRCHAPCIGGIDREEYKKIVNSAIEALKDRKILIRMLEDKMLKMAKLQNFEEAAQIRDSIKSIKNSLHVSEIDLARLENLDIFCIELKNNIAIIMKIFVRDGKIVSTDSSSIKNVHNTEKDELYKRALLQFYNNNSPLLCNQIIIGDDFIYKDEIELYLQKKYNKKIKITHPKIGNKAKLLDISRKNIKHLMTLEEKNKTVYIELQKFFNLSSAPYRIEIFDNSHLGGIAPVGSMVVWDQKWQKNSYRKYNLNNKDEYAQMRELLSRRVSDFCNNPPPDLWLLDGGSTLLKLAQEILKEHKIDLDVIAISKEKLDAKSVRSKGRAHDIVHSKKQSIKLPTSDTKLQFLQKLRDEAHRFAISFHQKKKIEIDMNSKLREIKGIGNATIKKLIAYFNSFDAIYNADIDELENILNKNLAQKVYLHIKEASI